MNHEDEALSGAFADTLASTFSLRSAMPLTIVNPDYGSPVNLDSLRTSGFYLSRNLPGTNAPIQDVTWGLYVIIDDDNKAHQDVSVSQTYQSPSGIWHRSSKDRGTTWSGWQSLMNEPAMPLKKTETDNLNQINQAGFYIGDGRGATNAPNSNAAWVLMVVAAPYGNQSYVMQTFYTDNGVWWRRSQNNGSTWSDWSSLIDEPSMPLKPLTGTVDLNQIRETGIYIGPGTAGTHAPASDSAWSVEVVAQTVSGQTHIIQTYKSESGNWWRSSSNSGSSWSEWHSDTNEPAMPLKKTETDDLNQINQAGFYIGDGRGATNAPNSNAAWVLMVVAAPYGNQSYVMQTFYTDNGIWWRRSQNNGSTWSDWSSLVDEPSMPLKTLSGTADLNQLRTTGIYIGPGTAGTHAPASDSAWSVEVVAQTLSGQTHIIQTYKSESGNWWRSSSNGGSSWSDWHSGTGVDQTFMPLTNLGGSDHIDLNQFKKIGYYVGNGFQAHNAPNNNGSWVLMVLTAPYTENPPYTTQYFFTDRGIWWRRSEDNGSTWSDWVNITSNDLVKAYGSVYLLGDAVIESNDFIPFTAMGPGSGCQLDAQTGEVVVNQAGVYSLSLSLHLNNNQPASFAISINGEAPEHHTSLYYEPATPTFTGIQPAHVTGILQCEAGQRIGIKNLTGHSVTLRHAIDGRKCKHEITLMKID